MSSDRDWKKWGMADPYFGVVTHAEFRREAITEDALQRFFLSGEEHAEHVFDVFSRLFGEVPHPEVLVDYGCGTGRLALPFARRAGRVIGLDISEGMLDEAVKNAAKAGIGNASFRLVNGDQLEVLPETVDFIHSFIVFQHIPKRRGEIIFESLLSRLRPGGLGAIQFTISSDRSYLQRLVSSARNRIPMLHPLINLMQGKKLTEPRMRMEQYDVSGLMTLLHNYGIDAYFCERTDHGGHIGIMLYFKNKKG